MTDDDIPILLEELARLRKIAVVAKRYAGRVEEVNERDLFWLHIPGCNHVHSDGESPCSCGFTPDHELLTSYIPT